MDLSTLAEAIQTARNIVSPLASLLRRVNYCVKSKLFYNSYYVEKGIDNVQLNITKKHNLDVEIPVALTWKKHCYEARQNVKCSDNERKFRMAVITI